MARDLYLNIAALVALQSLGVKGDELIERGSPDPAPNDPRAERDRNPSDIRSISAAQAKRDRRANRCKNR